MRALAPLHLRKLKSTMVLKGLSLARVAKAARPEVPYVVASDILRGARVSAKQLAALRKVIDAAPMPRETQEVLA